MLALLYSLILLYCLLYSFLTFYFVNKNVKTSYDQKNTNFTTKILVVIPAHNEEKNLTKCLEALQNINYSPNLLSIIVLADRCSDNTVNIAKIFGVHVLEDLPNENKCKGDLLKSFCQNHKNKILAYDTICLLDADSMVKPDFFINADKEFKKGHTIIQGVAEACQISNTAVSNFMMVLQSLINVFFYKSFSYKNYSILLNGKGMIISTKILSRIQWPVDSLVEDIEFSILALLKGYEIIFCENMKYEVLQPDTWIGFWHQQRRWISGQLSMNKYIFKIFNNVFVAHNKFIAPLYFLLVGLINSCNLVLLILLVIFAKINVLLPLFIFYYFSALTIAYFTVKYDKRTSKIESIIFFPLIFLLWSFICFTCLMFPQKKWLDISKNKIVITSMINKKFNFNL